MEKLEVPGSLRGLLHIHRFSSYYCHLNMQVSHDGVPCLEATQVD